ncbi:MAG: glycosyltransferase family 39 protein [bacterium]|nr:glycosyltransferase family 39 protein [bacterium]
MMNEPQPSKSLSGSDWTFLGSFALLKLLMHLPWLDRYGYHHDELYFLACGDHPAFGYVDHAPLVPWIARLADTLFGTSLYGLRIFPLLAGVAAVFLTGLLTRRLGGGRFAQATACGAMMVAPVFVRTSAMLHLPAFEQLFWVLCFYLIVRIVDEDHPRLWPWVGLIAGLGLLNKHSMLLFGFGLVAALLLTPQRKHLLSPWLWLGGAIAALFLLPNLLWQMAHGWPTVEFLRHLNDDTMAGISVLQFVLGQVLYLNPGTAPIWIAGLVFFFTRRGKTYRLLGWIYVCLFVLLVVIKSKIYYLAPAYPALLAGGGLALEQLIRRRDWGWLRPVTAGVLVIFGAIFAPLSLLVLPIDATERYISAMTFGAFENVYELTADLRGMFAWEERAEIVADVYHRLPPDERERTVIIASWYGPAGAIDYFGKELGLPRAVSTHMTYHLWGLPKEPFDTMIAVDISRERLEELFEEVTTAAYVELENVNPWEREFYVAICRKPRVDLRAGWPEWRRY